MELGIDILAMLFAAAFIAAFIDAIAGGGGLITIPALLMTGMPPAMALGTNKLQAFGGALSASIYFLRKRAVNLSAFSFILLVIFIGSVIGTLLIQSLDASLIKKGLPFLILAIGLYFYLHLNWVKVIVNNAFLTLFLRYVLVHYWVFMMAFSDQGRGH